MWLVLLTVKQKVSSLKPAQISGWKTFTEMASNSLRQVKVVKRKERALLSSWTRHGGLLMFIKLSDACVFFSSHHLVFMHHPCLLKLKGMFVKCCSLQLIDLHCPVIGCIDIWCVCGENVLLVMQQCSCMSMGGFYNYIKTFHAQIC